MGNDSAETRSRTPVAWLLVIALGGTLPFIDKAIHVDDPLYLGMAKQILESPLDPLGGEFEWGEGTWFSHPNPPLWPYLLAAVISVADWNELLFHVLQTLCYIAFVFACFQLANRVSDRPLRWTLVISWSPFLLPGINLMVDVPMLALGLWTIEWQFRAWESNRLGPAWIAGLLAGLAILTKYSAGLLLPVLLYGSWRYRAPRALAALVLPFVILGGWCLHNWLSYGQIHLGANSLGTEFMLLTDRWRVIVRGIGGVLWLTPIWCMALASRSRWQWITLALLFAVSVAVGWLDVRRTSVLLEEGGYWVRPSILIHYFIFAANGALGILLCVVVLIQGAPVSNSAFRRPREIFILWASIGIAFNLLIVPPVSFGAVRHLLSFLIPVCLAMAHPVDELVLNHRFKRTVADFVTFLHIALAFLLAHGDYVLAKCYRQISQQVFSPLAARGKVWMVGDPNFEYYADKQKIPKWRGELFRRGDFLVHTYLQGAAIRDTAVVANSDRVLTNSFESWNPVRPISQLANSYGGTEITMPWEFAIDVLETPAGSTIYSIPPVEEVYVQQFR